MTARTKDARVAVADLIYSTVDQIARWAGDGVAVTRTTDLRMAVRVDGEWVEVRVSRLADDGPQPSLLRRQAG